MKTVISIPDALFEATEGLCKHHRIPRNQFYTLAFKRMVDDYREKDVTERLDGSTNRESSSVDPAFTAAQVQTLKNKQW